MPKSKEKIFITGASGFLGTNTIMEFLDQGYPVKGLLRNISKSILPAHPLLELVEADILQKEKLAETMKGCRYVIHIAALTQQDLVSYEEYYKVNVEGSRNLIEAAIENRYLKFLFVGSANSFGYGSKKKPADEKSTIKAPFTSSHYCLSKLLAQELVFSKAEQIEVLTVNPTFMIGGNDIEPGSNRLLFWVKGKRISFYPPGGKNFVHVRDIARGIIRALEYGKNRESYLLCGENLSYRQFFKKIKKNCAQKTLLIPIPRFLLFLAGHTGDLLLKAGIRNLIHMANIKIIDRHCYYTCEKAMHDLGYKYKNIDYAIAEALKWFEKKT